MTAYIFHTDIETRIVTLDGGEEVPITGLYDLLGEAELVSPADPDLHDHVWVVAGPCRDGHWLGFQLDRVSDVLS